MRIDASLAPVPAIVTAHPALRVIPDFNIGKPAGW